MNDFLNGIFRIWEKLPDHSKEAFTKSLGVKQRSALQMGSQLLQYYATMAQQQAELEERMRQEKEGGETQNNSQKGYTYTYNTQASSQTSKKRDKKEEEEEDDDVIDVEWSDSENHYKPVGQNNKRK